SPFPLPGAGRKPPPDTDVDIVVWPPNSFVLKEVCGSICDHSSSNPGSSGRAALTDPSPKAPVVAATGEEGEAFTACAPSPACFTPVREPFSWRSGSSMGISHLPSDRRVKSAEQSRHVRRRGLVGAIVRRLHGLLEQHLLTTLSGSTLLSRRAGGLLTALHRSVRRLRGTISRLRGRLGPRLRCDVRRPGRHRRVLTLVRVQRPDELLQFSTRSPPAKSLRQDVLH